MVVILNIFVRYWSWLQDVLVKLEDFLISHCPSSAKIYDNFGKTKKIYYIETILFSFEIQKFLLLHPLTSVEFFSSRYSVLMKRLRICFEKMIW